MVVQVLAIGLLVIHGAFGQSTGIAGSKNVEMSVESTRPRPIAGGGLSGAGFGGGGAFAPDGFAPDLDYIFSLINTIPVLANLCPNRDCEIVNSILVYEHHSSSVLSNEINYPDIDPRANLQNNHSPNYRYK